MKRKEFLDFLRSRDLSDLEDKLFRPNIFELVGLQKQEIRHSNFLKELLNPGSPVGVGRAVLDAIVHHALEKAPEYLLDKNNLDAISYELSDVSDLEVRREYRNIDLLIVNKDSDVDFCIVIENKTQSSERRGQLEQYRTTIEKEFPGFQTLYVFLTPEGSEPEGDAAWIPISYKVVTSALRKVFNKNISDETKLLIRHYLELVEHRIMKQDELSHLANKIYQKHKLALDFIFENRADNVAVVSNELSSWVESDLRSIGFSPAYSTKSFVRFQSPDMERLSEILPGNGWGNSELIVWEFNIRQDRIDLKVTLGPCEDADARSQVRDVLNSALKGR